MQACRWTAWENGTFTQCGVQITQRHDYSFFLEQTEFVEAIEETKIAFSLGRGEDGASCDPVACEVPSDTEERTSTLVEGRNPDEGREGRLMALYTSLCRGPAKLLWDTTPKGQRRRG